MVHCGMDTATRSGASGEKCWVYHSENTSVETVVGMMIL